MIICIVCGIEQQKNPGMTFAITGNNQYVCGHCFNKKFKELYPYFHNIINNRYKKYKGKYYHQCELDTCEICGGYDGCFKGCECPECDKNLQEDNDNL